MNAAALIRGRCALVFDLDGTLADTAGDLWPALNAALADLGQPAVSRDTVVNSLHGGLPATARAALAGLSAPASMVDELIALYEIHYRRRAHTSSTSYAGVDQLLRRCSGLGIALGVCTNKSRADAVALLAKLGIAHWFDSVVGFDSVPRPKPHPDALQRALAELRATAREALFLGDSPVDASCASLAGVDFLLHLKGYGARMVSGVPVAGRFHEYADLLEASS